jgi:anti-sigma regulatory factor (Ser/Thr protein kinase)/class 3 adenylate cyclase
MAAPRIILFAGQRADAEGREGYFPPWLETSAREAIASHLEGEGELIGYASAAAGGDILFGEAVLERGGRLHIHIPCERGDFVTQYVAPAGDRWVERFDRLCAMAASVDVSCEERLLGDETLIRFNNLVLQGMARLEAERLSSHVHLLLLWSPSAPAELGSPADFMDQWPEMDRLSIIDLDDLRGDSASPIHAAGFDLDLDFGVSPRAIRAIMFADIATYTNFRDDEVPLLFDLLSEAQQMVEERAKPPLLINTWGDAIHAAAETAHDLADYASALLQAVAAIDPRRYGLERSPRFRIALHAGPVFVGLHPMTSRTMIFGYHVNRAARIEPIAEPGQMFASQHFVALLRAEMDARLYEAALTGTPYAPCYGMEYHGEVALPKQFGREVVYRVIDRRASAPAELETTSLSETSPPRLDVILRNDLAEIPQLAERIESFCEQQGLGAGLAYSINLSLDELLTNIISYGYPDGGEHEIHVFVERHPDRVTVGLSDDGIPYDPRHAPEPDLDSDIDSRPIGGLGIHFVRQMMDEVDYQHRGGRNELVLTKRLADE